MIHIKNAAEIVKMRESNRIVAQLLQNLEDYIKPGISTLEIDKIAEDYILSQGAKPAFKGYVAYGLSPFPASICASVNSCIVHGIPSRKIILKEGDIIGIDVGTFKNGFCGDGARTYKVGEVSRKAEELMEITKQALNAGIEQAKHGARIGDISSAISSLVKKKGYFVADNLTGHGIGKKMHEEPIVPNFGIRGKGPRLKKGMTIAIEPMVNIGTHRIHEKGWEFFVADDSLSAHFEHTILITEGEPEILTAC
ncbi:MAG TPA: type I methionyl aminopeptidase [Candidatus Cloacimonetes bacterium]|nr:type I methionyl aminopeptidase [Candidatus Cloacimonadota bacterium]